MILLVTRKCEKRNNQYNNIGHYVMDYIAVYHYRYLTY